MLTLTVQKRDIIGKKVKNLRKEDLIPAVLYGPKMRPSSVSIDYKSFEKVYKEAGGTALIKLDEKDAKDKDEDNIVLIREAIINPVSHKFMHVDFYQLPLDQKIEITVPINTSGEAPAVKTEGGTLLQTMHDVSIRVLPTELIGEILVDLSSLQHVGDSITIKDIPIQDNIEVLADSVASVFTVEAPRVEVEEVAEVDEEEAQEGQISDIKTEAEDKREDEEDSEEEASK